MSVEVRRVAGDHPVALELVTAMVAEIRTLYGGDMPVESAASPGQLSPPDGGFVVLYRDGAAVAGGGIKRLGADVCELKRMYVVPEARREGLGVALLRALESLAADLGYTVARLDTGAEQPGAQRLYEREGYASVADYNGNPDAAYWGEKALSMP